MNTEGRMWYLTGIAAIYLILCTTCCLYYASLIFRPDGAFVPVERQLLCLGMAVSAGLYFFRPKLGHRAFILLTILTLIVIGRSNPGASGFHFVVLLILMIPYMKSKQLSAGQIR